MSTLLLQVLEPFIPWPPKKTELTPLNLMLELAAAVWNASLVSDDEMREAMLDRVAGEIRVRTLPPEEIRRFVGELSARKLALYPSDRRVVSDAYAEIEGERLRVHATSLITKT